MLDPGRIPAGAAADSARGRPPLRRGRTPRQENVDATSTRPWRDVGATSARLRRKSSENCLVLGAFLPVRRPAAAGGLIQNPNEILIAKPLYKTNARCTFPWKSWKLMECHDRRSWQPSRSQASFDQGNTASDGRTRTSVAAVACDSYRSVFKLFL